MDKTELVARAKEKDEDAVAELIRLSEQKMTGIARLYTKNSADAQDAVQNAFIKCFRSIGTLEKPERFDSWLAAIVKNEALTLVSSAAHKNNVMFSDLANEDGTLQYDPADERIDSQPEMILNQEFIRQTVLKILDTLPEEQRLVAVMRFYDEMPLKEIAAKLGVPQTTVVSRLNYAKQGIKASVNDIHKREGIKLYNMAPLPYFIWLIQGLEGSAVYAGSAAAGAAAAGAAVKTGSMIGTGIARRIAAGVITAGLIGGGTYAANKQMGNGLFNNTINTPAETAESVVPAEKTESPSGENRDTDSDSTPDSADTKTQKKKKTAASASDPNTVGDLESKAYNVYSTEEDYKLAGPKQPQETVSPDEVQDLIDNAPTPTPKPATKDDPVIVDNTGSTPDPGTATEPHPGEDPEKDAACASIHAGGWWDVQSQSCVFTVSDDDIEVTEGSDEDEETKRHYEEMVYGCTSDGGRWDPTSDSCLYHVSDEDVSFD